MIKIPSAIQFRPESSPVYQPLHELVSVTATPFESAVLSSYAEPNKWARYMTGAAYTVERMVGKRGAKEVSRNL